MAALPSMLPVRLWSAETGYCLTGSRAWHVCDELWPPPLDRHSERTQKFLAIAMPSNLLRHNGV